MNQLSSQKRAQIVAALVEGNSIRGTVRMTGAAKNTVTKLLVDLGRACSDYQDQTLRNLASKRIECDEIWSFCHSKQKNVSPERGGEFGYGDVWTWVAIDADTKLVPTWLVGERNLADAYAFVDDLRRRLKGRVQLTTDGLRIYLDVVDTLMRDKVDYAVLHKVYGKEAGNETRYSPAVCTGTEKKIMMGDPDPRLISTSYIERQNLTMRMGMRRFTRLTNAFSKKVENLGHAVSLHFMHYNFARPHKTLSKPYPRTPAMAAGITDHVWGMNEIVGLLDKEGGSN
jgi:IS1 family transposase